MMDHRELRPGKLYVLTKVYNAWRLGKFESWMKNEISLPGALKRMNVGTPLMYLHKKEVVVKRPCVGPPRREIHYFFLCQDEIVQCQDEIVQVGLTQDGVEFLKVLKPVEANESK